MLRRRRVARIEAALDPVEAGGEHRGRGQVGVAGAVDGAILDPARLGDAQHHRPVVPAVGDVRGGPGGAAGRRADDQALVGGDGRGGERDVGLRVRLEPGDELVGDLAQAETPRVVAGIALEQVRLAVPKAHVEVAAVAGEVGEGLRHEGGDQAALLRHRLDHVAVEDRPVAGRERVGEVEVLLELAVGVLVVGRVHLPAQRVDVADDVGDEVERAGQRADVVTGLLERVERVGDLDPAVLGRADEEVLELAADLELDSRRRRPARPGAAGSSAGSRARPRPRRWRRRRTSRSRASRGAA